MIEGAFPEALLLICCEALQQAKDAARDSGAEERQLSVGNRRKMVTLRATDPFTAPALLASPFVRPLLKVLLGSEFILCSLTVVTAAAGAEEQRLHRDHSWLFPETKEPPAPSFAVTMLVPLFTVSEEIGSTRIVKGSHRVGSQVAASMPRQQCAFPAGSCLLMNYSVYHRAWPIALKWSGRC